MNKFFNIEIKDKRKARIYTGIIMLLFFLILLLPFFSYQNPPPGQEGVLVSFGAINQGQGSEAPSKPKPSTTKETKPKKTKPEKAKPKPEPKPKPKETKPKKVKNQVDEKVIAARNAEIALQKEKAKEEEQEKARKAEEVKERLAQAEAAAKQREEEAKAAALAEAQKKQDAEDFKNSLANSFGKGSGKGDGGDPGNQGNPDGDPNSDVLKGLSTGEGVIGGGLRGRGGKGPGISDNSNKTGIIVIYLCIDASGNVVSAKFTQKGSTTSDPELIKLAKDNAEKWNFNSGTTDTTCGTITYDFKVR